MDRPPFIIYALPRSRTAWLAHFLSGGGVRPCGHDLGALAPTLGGFFEGLEKVLSGTVETGAMMGWRALRKRFPTARVFVIRRPVDDVAASLLRCGLQVPRSVLDLRSAWLDEISEQYGVETIGVDALDDRAVCADIYRKCHGASCSDEWLDSVMGKNIQIDIGKRSEWLGMRAPVIEGLKAEAELADRRLRSAFLPYVEFGIEPWEAVEDVAPALGAVHFSEVNAAIEPRRPYRLDLDHMRIIQASGTMRFWTARVNGALAGYCMWTVQTDSESQGLLIARQGPWFIADRPEYRRLKLGVSLFDRSIAALKAEGVRCVFPHHQLDGRGADLGKFFRRRGGQEMQREYIMWIGS